ncbi:hypothetical protein CEXT_577351 [Caerostris extrusa]|uniref:Secreted protein n=1 Tax=Caerostris extrusa TaxID=172846 RepID=A0AAV4RFZ8_CAEEX|nr:hypothetical protein CEXT_577351 [Caerostris extrusa]
MKEVAAVLVTTVVFVAASRVDGYSTRFFFRTASKCDSHKTPPERQYHQDWTVHHMRESRCQLIFNRNTGLMCNTVL